MEDIDKTINKLPIWKLRNVRMGEINIMDERLTNISIVIIEELDGE